MDLPDSSYDPAPPVSTQEDKSAPEPATDSVHVPVESGNDCDMATATAEVENQ